MVEFHAKPRMVGNSWAILVPKEKAVEAKLNMNADCHVEIKRVPNFLDLAGTLKFKKSTRQIMKEIDAGWRE